MNGANLLLLAIGLLLTRAAAGATTATPGTTQASGPTPAAAGASTSSPGQSVASTQAPPTMTSLNFTGWTPTCSVSNITLPKDARFANYSAWVVKPTICSQPVINDLTTADVTIPQTCIDSTDKSVTLSFQPSPKPGRNFVGGHIFTEVKITCHPLDDSGRLFTASINVTVNDIAGTPTAMTAEPPITPPTMKLVTGTGTTTSAPPTFTLGQADVHLVISGTGGFYILPTICRGTSVDKPSNMYTFFTAEPSCAIDDEILGSFDVSKPDESSADFYPFMFSSGGTVTLTCEVLVCPDPLGGACQTTKDTIMDPSCAKGPVPQTTSLSPTPAGRRRRSVGESKPDTHVVELTYTVVGHDPALHGQTAAGAGMAVSIPLLAAVASLWIL